ncbi:MAG: hypothetical protein CM1200mP35_10360 [Chloroflexota bacterium]|nr:MAG: hypothetical protein CM1200mP35_10360 [Chloroflexota bacterium]
MLLSLLLVACGAAHPGRGESRPAGFGPPADTRCDCRPAAVEAPAAVESVRDNAVVVKEAEPAAWGLE